MTIYRQNSYKLLTIHKNEFRKTKNISKNYQNGSKMVVSIQIWIFAVSKVFFEEKVPTLLEFSLSFCYLYTPQLLVFADFEITKLSPPPTYSHHRSQGYSQMFQSVTNNHFIPQKRKITI